MVNKEEVSPKRVVIACAVNTLFVWSSWGYRMYPEDEHKEYGPAMFRNIHNKIVGTAPRKPDTAYILDHAFTLNKRQLKALGYRSMREATMTPFMFLVELVAASPEELHITQEEHSFLIKVAGMRLTHGKHGEEGAEMEELTDSETL